MRPLRFWRGGLKRSLITPEILPVDPAIAAKSAAHNLLTYRQQELGCHE